MLLLLLFFLILFLRDQRGKKGANASTYLSIHTRRCAKSYPEIGCSFGAVGSDNVTLQLLTFLLSDRETEAEREMTAGKKKKKIPKDLKGGGTKSGSSGPKSISSQQRSP